MARDGGRIGQHATMLSHRIPLALAATLWLAAACGGSSAPQPSSATPLQLPSSTAAPTASPSSGLPQEAPAVQGGKYYAVFLAVATDVQDEAIAAAQARAKKLGYEGGVGDLGCTPGAQQQLKLDPAKSYTGFSILLATKAQAQQVAAAYGDGVVGVAYVTAGCLD